MKSIILFCLVLCSQIAVFSQTKDTCVTTEEMKLYNLIMDYRAQNNLPKIPLSRSLSYVAHQHSWDLDVNQPVGGECNMHSWSKKGPWKACCYTPDHKQAKGMWEKPSELTGYKHTGYEISCGGSNDLSAETALDSWQGSEHHNDVILNKSIWEKYTWNSIGISIHGKYAVVWFGAEVDEAGEPNCKE